jgi:hypothetical protein
MKRHHFFEFNDSAWAPEALRESIVEVLSRTLSWGRMLRGLVDPFRDFVEATGAREVLDLCSGAGGPAAILTDELMRAGIRPPRFLLTDLQPRIDAWTSIKDAHPGVIDFVPTPVDATRVGRDLGRGRTRVIINALHHFRPALAASILRAACEDSPGVLVAEGFERKPLGFAPFVIAGLPAMCANPMLARRHRMQKAMLTWLTPATIAAAAWDGIVSTLRVYAEDELRAMVAPLGASLVWRYGTYEIAPFGRGYYFYGVRA